MSPRTLLNLVALAVIFSACTEPTREDVIARFPGGEKQVVAIYKGVGSDETLIERRTYDVSGELVLLEDLVEGKTLGWADLKKGLETSEDLQLAMQGDWYVMFAKHELVLSIVGTRYTKTLRSRLKDDGDNERWSNTVSGKLQYLRSRKVRLTEYNDDPPDSNLPAMDTTYFIDFQNNHSLVFVKSVLVDKRLVVGPIHDGQFYRDKGVAERHTPSADEIEIRADELRSAWRTALAGDNRIRTAYPSFYAQQVGLDASLGKEELADRAAAIGGLCTAIGPFKVRSDADDAVAQYQRQGMRSGIRSTQGQMFVGHWVQIRNIADEATASAMLDKLANAGLADAYLVRTEDEGLKISLGLFSELKDAKKIESHAKQFDLPAEIAPRMADRTVYFADVALPAGWDANAVIIKYGEDKVIQGDEVTCP